MKKIAVLIVLMYCSGSIFAKQCASYSNLIKSEILSDGGSINLVLITSCKNTVSMSYATSLENDAIFFLEGKKISPGSPREKATLGKIHQFLEMKFSRISKDEILQNETKKLIEGDSKTLIPVLGLMENLCTNPITYRNNERICENYILKKDK